MISAPYPVNVACKTTSENSYATKGSSGVTNRNQVTVPTLHPGYLPRSTPTDMAGDGGNNNMNTGEEQPDSLPTGICTFLLLHTYILTSNHVGIIYAIILVDASLLIFSDMLRI